MSQATAALTAAFDEYAAQYDLALARGISVSGEDKDFFAAGRVAWLARCLRGVVAGLRPSTIQPRNVMDFGCGTGSATPYLFEYLGAESVLGLDISEQSLDKARARHGSARVRFLNLHAYEPCGEIDLVYCNGVFHHIPPPQRAGVVEFIYRALRPGGWFALWENNPWSPGARYVMSRIPFDRDAVMVWPREAERLLRGAGFRHPRTTFTFIFPRMLAGLRWLEPPLARLPLGAQYQVLGFKPR